MLGSYSCRDELYTKDFDSEESPSGILARSGTYRVKSRVVDDDNEVYLGMWYSCLICAGHSRPRQNGSGRLSWPKSGEWMLCTLRFKFIVFLLRYIWKHDHSTRSARHAPCMLSYYASCSNCWPKIPLLYHLCTTTRSDNMGRSAACCSQALRLLDTRRQAYWHPPIVLSMR